jgi:hypothetical protein
MRFSERLKIHGSMGVGYPIAPERMRSFGRPVDYRWQRGHQ